MKTFTKKYQLWVRDGTTAAFVPTEFDTLNECIMADKQGDWYITKGVELVVQEAGLLGGIGPAIPAAQLNPPSNPTMYATAENHIPADEEEELTPQQKAYLGATGPIGTIT